MQTNEVIDVAKKHLESLSGHVFDVLTVSQPVSPEAGTNLAKVISKLSPMLGNMIEFNSVEYLNDQKEFNGVGKWARQDPGFPDTIFEGVDPTPGIEMKAWFPLSTEITARFRDSQNHFAQDNIYVAMLAWLPENLIYGKPYILGVCVVSGLSVARARDEHYHQPPHYLVIEPEDTSHRTANLQQSNTAGYVFQGTQAEFAEAQKLVDSWGPNGRQYKPTPEYQRNLRDLMTRYNYRLDTNYSKMDRIFHQEIEDFKSAIYERQIHGMKIKEWSKLLRSKNEGAIKHALTQNLGITEADADQLLV